MTLVKFSSGNKPPVKGIVDNPMKLKDLIKEMRQQGVDIFPDCDSHCYIEGLPLKVKIGKFPWSLYHNIFFGGLEDFPESGWIFF